jgi:hypothetical protein
MPVHNDPFAIDFTKDPRDYVADILRLLVRIDSSSADVLHFAVWQLRRGRPLPFAYFAALSLSTHCSHVPKLDLDGRFRLLARVTSGELLALRLAELEALEAFERYQDTAAVLHCLIRNQALDPFFLENLPYNGTIRELVNDIRKARRSINRLLRWPEYSEEFSRVRSDCRTRIVTIRTKEKLQAVFSQRSFNTFASVTAEDVRIPFAAELTELVDEAMDDVRAHFVRCGLLDVPPTNMQPSDIAFFQHQFANALEKCIDESVWANQKVADDSVIPERFFSYLTSVQRHGVPAHGLARFHLRRDPSATR